MTTEYSRIALMRNAVKADLREAYRRGDWRTLHYPSWEAYVAAEFGDLTPEVFEWAREVSA